MTVAGQITDEKMAEMQAAADQFNHGPAAFEAYLRLCNPVNITAILTELQHRREAEAVAPEGWALVPREPTEEMLLAGAEMHDHWAGATTIGALNAKRNVKEIWPALLAASPSSPASGVRVKKLDWSSYGGLRWRAKSPLGRITVNPDSERRFYVSVNGDPLAGRHATSEDAMAAAQSYYAVAILSALGEHP